MMNRNSCGFTLIELLIALTLIGLMTALLFGALRFSGKAWTATDESTERDTEIRLVWQYLSDRLEQARTLSATGKTTDGSYFFFAGNSGAVEFVSPMPANMGSGGVYIIRLYSAPSNDSQQFRLARWLYHPEILEGKEGLPRWEPLKNASLYSSETNLQDLRAYYSESTLVDELETVSFSYFGPEGINDEHGNWLDEWEDKAFLPWLLKIEVTDKKGQWPELVFELPSS